MMLDADFGGGFHLPDAAARRVGEHGRAHRRSRADFAHATHLGPRNTGVVLNQKANRGGSQQTFAQAVG